MRGDQISRQWRLLRVLSDRSGGVPVRELADDLGVSIRTVYRDLEILERVGIPLMQEREGRQVSWRLLEPRSVRLGPAWSVEELTVLYQARRCLAGNAGAPPLDAFDRVVGKIERTVPARFVHEARAAADET